MISDESTKFDSKVIRGADEKLDSKLDNKVVNITEAEDEDETYRKQVEKQKHISMWHLISQHVLSDVVSKIGNEQLDEINNNKTVAETNTDNSP
ncbi:hypothetical protein KY289_008219 [Solanum tuberosum]|nr:hypothetical protein KY289_008219 [Solanum tuberosum]